MEPTLTLNLPAAHAAQSGEPSGPVYPSLHLQDFAPKLPARLHEFTDGQETHGSNAFTAKLPGGQVAQVSEPFFTLTIPAAHSKHAPPLGPEKPAAHTQADLLALPRGETELSGQLVHVAGESAPIAELYLPAAHASHG